MGEKKKNILIICPSRMIARGLETVLEEHSEFRVGNILSDMGRGSEAALRNVDADCIVVDPAVLDYAGRQNVRASISEFSEAPVVALQTVMMEEEAWKLYDEVISLYDTPTTIVKKLRKALEAGAETPKSEGNELSLREKEILVCVAKGMLNKEIADEFNLSIYTVMTHRKNITKKTGIKTVAGLTVYALLNNLIDSNSIE